MGAVLGTRDRHVAWKSQGKGLPGHRRNKNCAFGRSRGLEVWGKSVWLSDPREQDLKPGQDQRVFCKQDLESGLGS
jgi:hypothetical protein